MDNDFRNEILGPWIRDDGHLYDLGAYLSYTVGYSRACLDGEFTADELEAIALYMRETEKR